MRAGMTIGKLARLLGIPTSTVRFYERQRLLLPDERSAGNYRLYGEASVARLRFIRAAQAVGFTLDDVSTLLSFHDGDTGACAEVQRLLKHRLDETRQKMRDLRDGQTVLLRLMRVCRAFERTGRCEVLRRLTLTSSGAPRAARRSSTRRMRPKST